MTVVTPDSETISLEDMEFQTPCDFAEESMCPDDPAEWIMHRVACCPAKLRAALACTKCKDDRLLNRISVICKSCGHVWLDACNAYTYIEPLRHS